MVESAVDSTTDRRCVYPHVLRVAPPQDHNPSAGQAAALTTILAGAVIQAAFTACLPGRLSSSVLGTPGVTMTHAGP